MERAGGGVSHNGAQEAREQNRKEDELKDIQDKWL
jgi:hypothetical protein